jgi:omega-6 fatty acid desaturase (delta-12 desaturase)
MKKISAQIQGAPVSGWQKIIRPYQIADNRQAAWQLINSLIPFIALYAMMLWVIRYSYGLTIPFIILTAGFQMRLFIIFHDCGHGSFSRSRQANTSIGSILGVLVYTPAEQWWHDHAIHHATSGDLDRRGTGDVMTLTVKEYTAAPGWKKLGYRLFRSPLVMFGLGPYYVFGIVNRLPYRKTSRKELVNLILTDLAIVIKIMALSWVIGWQRVLAIELPVLFLAGSMGIWLFYVQHQFEDMHWVRTNDWDYAKSALLGASFYKLPRLLQWFSGNIGFHHIHHLSPRIPNYKLEKCSVENPELEPSTVLTLRSSLKCVTLSLFDEDSGRMVRFSDLKPSRLAVGSTNQS